MEKPRKYELTEEELETLIFLAASRVCELEGLKEDEQKEICGNAAEISVELLDHLTGENPFDPKEIELADALLHRRSKMIVIRIER